VRRRLRAPPPRRSGRKYRSFSISSWTRAGSSTTMQR
jgi:hypothetical protein